MKIKKFEYGLCALITIFLLMLIVHLPVSVLAQPGPPTDIIETVNPSSANLGETNLLVTITLQARGAPPAEVKPISVSIGNLEGNSIQRNQLTVTAVFAIPDNETTDMKTVSVEFLAPNNQTVVFSKENAFKILADAIDPPPVNTDTYDGYMLISPIRSKNIFLVDLNKNIVKTWTSEYEAVNAAYLLEDGSMLRGGKVSKTIDECRFSGPGMGGIVERIDWGNNVIWSYEMADNAHCLHHDIEVLPNGNILMIASEYKSHDMVLAAGRNPDYISNEGLWPDKIIEVNPTNNQIVWEWHTWDHLVQDYDNTKDNYGDVSANPQLINVNHSKVLSGAAPPWHHSNAIAYNSELDQIILSVHDFDEFWIIDHSTSTAEAASHSGGVYGKGGDLLYRLGNPAAYNTSGEHKFYGQHNVHWIPSGLPGAGNILIFNNGKGLPRGSEYSRVEEIILNTTTPGYYWVEENQAFVPYSQVWTYQAPSPTDFYADAISGAQRLANGNTLICDGPAGFIFEVNNDGTILWTYQNPEGTPVFRAYKYPPEYPGLSQLNITPVIQAIADEIPTEYALFQNYPNPFVSASNIKFALPKKSQVTLKIYDLSGRLAMTLVDEKLEAGDHTVGWNAKNFPAGVYFCKIQVRADLEVNNYTKTRKMIMVR